ncbi:MAG: peroxide stress protein YaaA [Planctomycetota bacterium]|nr:MAG: peroxide stress protein YaaA [Planctomycetota bacterium]
MLTLLSPAKRLQTSPQKTPVRPTQPRLLDQAAALIAILRDIPPEELARLMNISRDLAVQNADRYQRWSRPHRVSNSTPAALLFRGDVYQGLQADAFSPEDWRFAQQHVRILSGLYGVLRPLDLVQPYRLEMGTRLPNPRGQDLYAYWRDRVTDLLSRDLKRHGTPVVVNLASEEYARAIEFAALGVPVITPRFLECKGGNCRVLSFFAKRARGRMAAWIVRNRIDDPERLRDFAEDGYRLDTQRSDATTLTFVRPQPAARAH